MYQFHVSTTSFFQTSRTKIYMFIGHMNFMLSSLTALNSVTIKTKEQNFCIMFARPADKITRINCQNCAQVIQLPNEIGSYCRKCYITWYIPYQQRKFKASVLNKPTGVSDLLNFARIDIDKSFNDTIKLSANEDCFSDYHCQISTDGVHCGFKGSQSKFMTHLNNAHANVLYLQPKSHCVWGKTNAEYQVDVIFEDGEMFFLHRKLVEHENSEQVMYWALQHIGRPAVATNYTCVIEIKCHGRKIFFIDECHPNEDDFEVIINTGLCMGVPISTFKTFMGADGFVLYTVHVKTK